MQNQWIHLFYADALALFPDDPLFELAEVLSWMRALPRIEAHVLDGGHELLETRAPAAVSPMRDFIGRTHSAKNGQRE